MSDAANPDTLDYDFATPHTNGTSISGEPMNEVRRTTARRVSFGEIAAEYLKSLSPQEPSPHKTPTEVPNRGADNKTPYLQPTDSRILGFTAQCFILLYIFPLRSSLKLLVIKPRSSPRPPSRCWIASWIVLFR